MLINFLWKIALFDLTQPATSLLLFADNDFETSTYKRELYQKILISAKRKRWACKPQSISSKFDIRDFFFT